MRLLSVLLLATALSADMRLIEINADSLNVRLQPSTSSPKIATVLQGERFYTSDPAEGEWLMIMVENEAGMQFGYIASKFTRVIQLSREHNGTK